MDPQHDGDPCRQGALHGHGDQKQIHLLRFFQLESLLHQFVHIRCADAHVDPGIVVRHLDRGVVQGHEG